MHRVPFLEKASDAIEQFDVFVLTSSFEGAPYTALEAMVAGVPVVLTDVVGNADSVEHGVTGLLVPFGDAPAMAGCVVTLLTDADLRVGLAEQAQIRVKERFSKAEMGQKLEILYFGL